MLALLIARYLVIYLQSTRTAQQRPSAYAVTAVQDAVFAILQTVPASSPPVRSEG